VAVLNESDTGQNNNRTRLFSILSLFLVASVILILFIFFGDSRNSCNKSMLVSVIETRDSSGIKLILKDDGGIPYQPLIINHEAVISSGSRVRICYEGIDTLADKTLQLRIIDVVALP